MGVLSDQHSTTSVPGRQHIKPLKIIALIGYGDFHGHQTEPRGSKVFSQQSVTQSEIPAAKTKYPPRPPYQDGAENRLIFRLSAKT